MSKGGSNTSSTQVPAWLESAAIENINKGRDVSQIGYTPYYGPDVAAFNPMQQQSMQSTGNAASAFGLAPQGFDAMAGMPEAQTFAGGVQGYSSAPLYEQSLDKLFANAPAQYNAINSMFIDPFTGAAPRSGYGATPTQTSQMVGGGGGGDMGGGTSGGGINTGSTGEYYGVNEQYNPHKYSNPTEDISGDGVIDYRDMSFGEAGRRDIGFGENVGNFIKSATGIGAIEKAIDYGQGLADGFTPSPSNGLLTQTSGQSMTPEESQGIINNGAGRYEERFALEEQERINRQRNDDDMLRNDMYPSDIMSLIGSGGYQSEQLAENARIEAEAKRVQARIAEQTAISNAAAAKAKAAAAARARQSNNNGGGNNNNNNGGGGGYTGGGGSSSSAKGAGTAKSGYSFGL
jgi:hypothetical protein